MEATQTEREKALTKFFQEQKKIDDDFIERFKEIGIPVPPPAQGIYLDRLAALYGIGRKLSETDRHFRKRINEYIAYLEKENREKTLKETYDVFYPAPWQTE